jgi:superfamily II DNA or RNA helicase
LTNREREILKHWLRNTGNETIRENVVKILDEDININRDIIPVGLTATPERLDNKDVFALCDYNFNYCKY